MPEKPTSKNLSLRPGDGVLARLDALAASTTALTGITARRGGVAIDALVIGLDVLESRARERTRRAKGVRA